MNNEVGTQCGEEDAEKEGAGQRSARDLGTGQAQPTPRRLALMADGACVELGTGRG